MKNKIIVSSLVFVVAAITFMPAAAAVSLDPVPEAGSIHSYNLVDGYSSIFTDVPFVSDHYIIIQVDNASRYLIDVPDGDYTMYNFNGNRLLYSPSSVRMLGISTAGTPYYFTFGYNSTEVSYRLLDGNNLTTQTGSYTILPVNLTLGEGDQSVVVDLYAEMGFIPDTVETYTQTSSDQTNLSVYFYIIIFLLASIYTCVLIRGRS